MRSPGAEVGWFFALCVGAVTLLHGSIAGFGLDFSLAPDAPALLLYLAGLATPTAVAIAICARGSRRRFLARVLRPRGSAAVLACAALAQLGFVALALTLAKLGGAEASPRFRVASGFGLLAVGQLWVVLGEELGWRGFALPRLERMMSARRATLVLAVVWGVWHAPMFFVPGSLQAAEPVWLFAAAIFAWSCVHTALHHSARPSVLPNLLFHACANITLNLVEIPPQARAALAAAYALGGAAIWVLLLGPGRTSRAADR